MLVMNIPHLLLALVAVAAAAPVPAPVPVPVPLAGSSFNNIAALEARFPKLASEGAAAHNLSGRGGFLGSSMLASKREAAPEPPAQANNMRPSPEEKLEIARRGYAVSRMLKRTPTPPSRNTRRWSE
ncbi:hypothetical protein MAPG_06966 [Magnaporthiopsis poae ATCC 64411]|uniref:Uncharacterized protein n=1 Tax=Magnaporthiopsis poae (strain ATCC 64411 / 73-15) TaxID=644358 RepID=A0A0C4E3G7_MAGP6|nr:hypothetical protein MAPG_06966 [Magnaporthiopsis poae ATCC 64411]